INVEDRLLILGVVGFDGDGHVLIVVGLDCGKGGGWRHRGWRMIFGSGGDGYAQQQGAQQQWARQGQEVREKSHRTRLYHRMVRHRRSRFSYAWFFFSTI